jgi:YbgC/YbaW family acyl-CoA thioester hydrolase
MSSPVSPFVYRRRVQFAETDMAGIVHFSNYYRYMEEAEHAWFRSLGLSIMQTWPDGTVIGWPRVRSACSYEAPARYDDEIEIRVHVSRKGVKSLTLEFEFRRGETRLARGTLKTVCCIIEHGQELKSIEIPPAYGDMIQEMPQAVEP